MLLLLFQSSVTREYDWLFWSMVALCGSVGIAIATFLIYCTWRYRRRDPNELPPAIKNNIPAEVAWIGIPSLLFLAMFFAGVKLYFDIERPPNDSEDIYVVGKQWMWKLQHQDGQREINELHVPVGRAIRLNMISQDVIHSFYVPSFHIKQDVLPKRYTTIWFRATKPGIYHLFCAEYCGTNHSQMGGWIYALDANEYRAWLEQGAAEGSLASTGEKLFHQFACSNCHHYSGHGRGPNLVGLYGREVNLTGDGSVIANDTYIRQSILQPKSQITEGFQDIMPTYQGQLTEEDVIALIAYIKALGYRPLPKQASGADMGSPAYVNNPQGPPAGSTEPNGTQPGVH